MTSAAEFDAAIQPAATPAPEPTPAPAEPVVPPAEPAKVETPEPTPTLAAEPASAEPVRDEKGRFVKVAVHARLMGEKDSRIEELEGQVKTLREATPAPPKTIEAIEKLKQKFVAQGFADELQELLTAVSGELLTRDEQVAKLEKALDGYQSEAQRQEQAAAEKSAEAVSAEIAKNPTLRGWLDGYLAEEPTPEAKLAWDTAKEHDAALRKMPAWRDKPMAERFEEAVSRTSRDLGLPLAAKPAEAARPALPPKPLPAPIAPASISNIPTGLSPNSPNNSAAGMSLHNAIHATQNMTRAQAEKLLLHGG